VQPNSFLLSDQDTNTQLEEAKERKKRSDVRKRSRAQQRCVPGVRHVVDSRCPLARARAGRVQQLSTMNATRYVGFRSPASMMDSLQISDQGGVALLLERLDVPSLYVHACAKGVSGSLAPSRLARTCATPHCQHTHQAAKAAKSLTWLVTQWLWGTIVTAAVRAPRHCLAAGDREHRERRVHAARLPVHWAAHQAVYFGHHG
jgi:hypothetical protein